MHVGVKKIATAGLLAAFGAVLLVLSTVIESNSLILIGVASFTVGIAIREWGIGFGVRFLIASSIVNFFVTPNKFHCATYVAMGIYLLTNEFLWELLAKKSGSRHRNQILWILKYAIFNVMYIPALFCLPEVLFVKEISDKVLLIFLLFGQAALFIYDQAYMYFQGRIWGRLRQKLL